MKHMKPFLFVFLLLLVGCQTKEETPVEPVSQNKFLLGTIVNITLYDNPKQEIFDEIFNAIEEIETRGAKAFVISSEPLFKKEDVFHIPVVKEYLSIIPMVFVSQYLAYYVALKKGVDIDKPRNLAKSVTVE